MCVVASLLGLEISVFLLHPFSSYAFFSLGCDGGLQLSLYHAVVASSAHLFKHMPLQTLWELNDMLTASHNARDNDIR